MLIAKGTAESRPLYYFIAMKKENKKTLIIALLTFCLGVFVGLYISPRPSPEPVIKYVPLSPISVEKDSADLTPISARQPDSIIYITVYRDRPANAEPAAPDVPSQSIIDTLASYRATVEDWNVERIYKETLINSDTLGHATLEATVQYNMLTGMNFQYIPVQRQETTISASRRLEGYGLMNITNQYSSLGLGVKFGRVGVHAIGGYDYKGTAFVYGAGMMVTF